MYSKEKKKIGFNAVDGVIIILIAVTVFAAVLIRLPSVKERKSVINITYSLSLIDVPDSLRENISKGDKVINYEDGAQIGTVSEVVYDKGSVTVSVNAKAEESEGNLLVSGVKISSGEKYQIRFPSLYCEAVVQLTED